MNMVQKRDLIGKSEKLAIIIITLLEVTYLMVKFGVYEVKTIYTMIIIVFILTVFFVYLNVPPLLMSLLFFIRSKVILTNTTPTDTTHIETTTTDIPHIETTPMDIITETTHIETISMDTTPMYTHTNTTTTDTAPIETIDNNINNTYIKVDSTNKDNFLGNKNKNKEKNKLNIAEKYIIETFTGLCSEEEIKNIYAAIKAYSNGETDFLNYSSISVKNLKVLDLYHFGWNIWNHFRVGEQDVIAKLLKIIFAEKFSRTSIKTIKSHLKDDEKKGRIIIKEDLSKLNE
ncbi:hypothetical protein [uncultured Capnocytophaga sp.]|uniref:hypothetical protein n=1 Tax=uncultured Capnocytophaga sp. TaxID=159273 RepID=UPI0028E973E8|nr:hypothetical protein [uncultured Capnocytophaga sp.]